jgi:hypothetical protein
MTEAKEVKKIVVRTEDTSKFVRRVCHIDSSEPLKMVAAGR